MDDKLREAIAVFRYGLIAPVLHRDGRGQAAYFREMAQAPLPVPGGAAPRRYSIATFKLWLRHYRRHGLEGLIPKQRADLGVSRVISDELSATLAHRLAECPKLPVAHLRERLVGEGLIPPDRISESTLRRHIRDRRLRPQAPASPPRKPFEKPLPNDLWTLDFLHGPKVAVAGRRWPQATYLAAAIDDHSRFIPVAGFYLAEDSRAVAAALKDGFLRYGLPRMLYCDNGPAFVSRHLVLACARLGVALVHSRPYDPASRGKIERYFRTVRSRFLLGLGKLASLEELNRRFADWLEDDYHRRHHRGIDQRPLDRYLDALGVTERRLLTRDELDLVFYRTLTRKVRNDATVQIRHRLWEVPPERIGETVEIRHPEDRPDELYLVESGALLGRLRPVDLTDNAERPRPVRFALHPDDTEETS